jgi:hypothetical protein
MDHNLSKLVSEFYQSRQPASPPQRKQVLTEAWGLSNFNYRLPEDPQEKVYDFYFLSLVGNPDNLADVISTRVMGSAQDSMSKAAGHEVADKGTGRGIISDSQAMELQMTVKETFEKLLNHLQEDLLDATYFSISAEMKHVTSRNSVEEVAKLASEMGLSKEFAKYWKNFNYAKNQIGDSKKMIKSMVPKGDPMRQLAIRADIYDKHMKKGSTPVDPETGEQFDDNDQWDQDAVNTFFKGETSRIASYTAAKSAFPNDEDWVAFATRCFYELKWNSSYGGPAWGGIGDGYKRLHDANTPMEKMIWIDHIFDLEHNTGAMLNKVTRYAKGGGYGWIKKALDYKRDSKQPLKDFMDKISPQMGALARKLRYALTGMAEDNPAWKEFGQQTEKQDVVTNVDNLKSTPHDITSGKFGGADDQVMSSTDLYGTIFKIGSTDKIYVDWIDSPDTLIPGSLESPTLMVIDQYYFKYDTDGKLDGLLNKSSGQKVSASTENIPKEAWIMFKEIVPAPQEEDDLKYDDFDEDGPPWESKKTVKGPPKNPNELSIWDFDKSTTIKTDANNGGSMADGRVYSATLGANGDYLTATLFLPQATSQIYSEYGTLPEGVSSQMHNEVNKHKLMPADFVIEHPDDSDEILSTFVNNFKGVFQKKDGKFVGMVKKDTSNFIGNIHLWTAAFGLGLEKAGSDYWPGSKFVPINYTKSTLPPKLPLPAQKKKLSKKKAMSKKKKSYAKPQPKKIPGTSVAPPPSSTVLQSIGVYTNLLSKFHPKPVAHTGPAGKKGVNTLVVKTSDYSFNAKGRYGYSGYFKVKSAHTGKDIMFFEKTSKPRKLAVKVGNSTQFIAPHKDKAIVQNLHFVLRNGILFLRSGVILGATLKAGVVISGNVTLIDCILDGCALSDKGEQMHKYENVLDKGLYEFDEKSFKKFAQYSDNVPYDKINGAKLFVTSSYSTGPGHHMTPYEVSG